MNKSLEKQSQSKHTIRDVLLPFSLSLFLLFFLIWIIVVSLQTKQVQFSPNSQQVTTGDQSKGGDDS